MSTKDDQFAEASLKDALDGIHKTVGARLVVMGLFFSLISGSFALAAAQKALVFLIAATLLTIIFLAIELPQRMALCSYYFKYIDVARNQYSRDSDYVWLAGFTLIGLLRRLNDVAAGKYADADEKAVALNPKYKEAFFDLGVAYYNRGAKPLGVRQSSGALTTE